MPMDQRDLELASSFMAPPSAARPGSRRLPTPQPGRRGIVGQMPMMPMASTTDYMGSPAGRELLRRVLDGLRRVK